ncbi:deaminase domain-containing protein [Endozoicomonas numazuensis]|uniref:deaminase domain-containing protein n=1 Tax=Endozoicomonas numazuensis TaxID=1137799 RepID=UPI00068ED43B|nr:deaminase domain-containing protein [Endozoicomonas numazuensis]
MEPTLRRPLIAGVLSDHTTKRKTRFHRKKETEPRQKTMPRSERIRYNARAKHDYTDILSRKISHFRKDMKDNIGDRNVAIAVIKHSVSNTEEFVAVSGTDTRVGLSVPRNRAFETFDIRHDRSCDAEVKIFEYLDKKIKIDSKASVFLHSELPVCDSCRYVIDQFKDKYDKIKIFTSYSLLDQL